MDPLLLPESPRPSPDDPTGLMAALGGTDGLRGRVTDEGSGHLTDLENQMLA